MAYGQDSFDHYATAQMYWKWTVPVAFAGIGYNYQDGGKIIAAAGRCGTAGLVVQPAGPVIDGCGPHLTVAAGSASGVIGFYAKAHGYLAPLWLAKIKNLGTGDGNTQCGILLRTDGQLQVTRGGGDCGLTHSAPTILGQGGIAHQDVGYFYELVYTINTSTGSIALWQNGVNVIPTISGINTAGQGANAWNGIELGRCATDGGASAAYPGGVWVAYDDFYWLDTTDSAPRNARLGDVKVACKMPNANGAVQQWTAVPGPTAYQMINEIPPDGDTSYIADTTAGHISTFGYPALDIASGSIFWVSVLPAASKDDAGFKEISGVARIGGVNYTAPSPAAPSLTDYAYFPQQFSQNPNTVADWTVGGVNGAEFGVDVAV